MQRNWHFQTEIFAFCKSPLFPPQCGCFFPVYLSFSSHYRSMGNFLANDSVESFSAFCARIKYIFASIFFCGIGITVRRFFLCSPSFFSSKIMETSFVPFCFSSCFWHCFSRFCHAFWHSLLGGTANFCRKYGNHYDF